MLLEAIIFGSIAGISTLLGISFVDKFKKFDKYSSFLLSFAAGVLLATAFIYLIPESQLNTSWPLVLLFSFLLFYLLEHFLLIHSHRGIQTRRRASGIVATVGIGIHSLIDGIVIGAGFGISFSLGIIATISVILHEFPEGFTIMAVLRSLKFDRRNAYVLSSIVALATPLGAIATALFARGLSESILGALLAIAAGSFIYIAASDLIPELHAKYEKSNAVGLFLGVALIMIIGSFL